MMQPISMSMDVAMMQKRQADIAKTLSFIKNAEHLVLTIYIQNFQCFLEKLFRS